MTTTKVRERKAPKHESDAATGDAASAVALSSAEHAAKAFAEHARSVDVVDKVVSVASGPALSVWTLLANDRGGIGRRRIYDLELLARQQHPDAALEFRVIDAADYSEARRDSLLPTGANVLWERPHLATSAPVHAG